MLVPTLQHCVGSAPAPLHHGHPFFFFSLFVFPDEVLSSESNIAENCFQPASSSYAVNSQLSQPAVRSSKCLSRARLAVFQCELSKAGGCQRLFFFFERGWGKKDGDPYIISSFSYSEVAAQRERCFAKAFRYNIV